jgi:hypothetical protein
MEKVLKYL